MKSDPASDALLPGLLRVSLLGLLAATLALAVGHMVGDSVTGTSPIAIVVRLVGAVLRGFGIGFGLLFLLTSVSGCLYVALRRMTRR